MKYRKKTAVVDAIQWTGKNTEEVLAFFPDIQQTGCPYMRGWLRAIEKGKPEEAKHIVAEGDYIVKVGKEYYPRRPAIFEKDYEEV